MKLPKGAFITDTEHALEIDGELIVVDGKARPQVYIWGADRCIAALSPQDARTLVRRILRAIDRAEALQHAAKIVRRHS